MAVGSQIDLRVARHDRAAQRVLSHPTRFPTATYTLYVYRMPYMDLLPDLIFVFPLPHLRSLFLHAFIHSQSYTVAALPSCWSSPLRETQQIATRSKLIGMCTSTVQTSYRTTHVVTPKQDVKLNESDYTALDRVSILPSTETTKPLKRDSGPEPTLTSTVT